MRKKKREGIYTTYGPEKLLCSAAKVNGKKALAYQKDGEEISYIPLEDVDKKFETGQFLEIITVEQA